MGRACMTYGRIQKCAVLMGKPEAKNHLGRSRRRWEDNVKMDLIEVVCDVGDLVDLA